MSEKIIGSRGGTSGGREVPDHFRKLNRQYPANSIGVPFKSEFSLERVRSHWGWAYRVHLWIAGGKKSKLAEDLAQRSVVILIPATYKQQYLGEIDGHSAAFVKPNKSVFGRIPSAAEFVKNDDEYAEKTCVVQNKLFTARIVFNYQSHELIELRYTPTNTRETRRESEGILSDRGQPPKQKQRKGELPFPKLSHRAEANRTGEKLNIRVDPELVQRVKEAAKAEGIPQTEWLERLLRNALEP